ncbi:hypothetical protein J5277_13110 [Rhizobium sp. 16-449-1b]|uniref:hypothetical protein n=1 Tax=Rhizobium sp. 16-449-1b TaxID=2819989 RepID=UPI001ADD22A8|nr:hypothetical protein [Rhizobium sp. 16-449-1b]MBO9195043.1 hypothetical protein [Rhizobium sp. 16-449-1b]
MLITDVVTMWEKLYWDVEQYQDIQRSHPHERQPLAFAAINVCIAAWSLEQWARTAWLSNIRNDSRKADGNLFNDFVRQHVPEQAICADIANTSKHAAYRDENWQGGEASLEWEDGDEDMPPTFVLRHVGSAGAAKVSAYETFDKVRDHWWSLLIAVGLAAGPMYPPEFMQNKLRRIFGDWPVEPPSDIHPVTSK